MGTFRLDDPGGEVGVECFLFGSSQGCTLFVPVTYRGAELAGGEEHLLGTMQHSVLGDRGVYDGCADPVFFSTVVDVIRAAGSEAEQHLHRRDGTIEIREPSARARGTGTSALPAPQSGPAVAPIDEGGRTLVAAGGITLAVARQVGVDLPDGPSLIGSFAGGDNLILATVSFV